MSGNDDEKDDETPSAEIIAWPKPPHTRQPAPRPTAEGPRDEAEALVVKALASITGREPDDIIREIRAREDGEGTRESGDDEAPQENIIDLNAVREARHSHAGSHDGQAEMGELFRAGFRAVMDELTQLRPSGGELVIDAAFMREHGPRLLGSVFSSLGRAFLAKETPDPASTRENEVASDAGAKDAVTDAPGDAATHDAQPSHSGENPAHPPETPVRPVEIRVDFGSLAVSLLSRLGIFGGRTTPPPSPAPDANPGSTGAPESAGSNDEGPNGPADA